MKKRLIFLFLLIGSMAYGQIGNFRRVNVKDFIAFKNQDSLIYTPISEYGWIYTFEDSLHFINDTGEDWNLLRFSPTTYYVIDSTGEGVTPDTITELTINRIDTVNHTHMFRPKNLILYKGGGVIRTFSDQDSILIHTADLAPGGDTISKPVRIRSGDAIGLQSGDLYIYSGTATTPGNGFLGFKHDSIDWVNDWFAKTQVIGDSSMRLATTAFVRRNPEVDPIVRAIIGIVKSDGDSIQRAIPVMDYMPAYNLVLVETYSEDSIYNVGDLVRYAGSDSIEYTFIIKNHFHAGFFPTPLTELISYGNIIHIGLPELDPVYDADSLNRFWVIRPDSISIGDNIYEKDILDVVGDDGILTDLDSISPHNIRLTIKTDTTGNYWVIKNGVAKTSIYGALYNQYTIDDPRGITPSGWRVPTSTDFTILINELGGETYAGGHLKDTLYWTVPNVGATDSVGFQARGASMRWDEFAGLGEIAGVWSKSLAPGGLNGEIECLVFSNSGEDTYLANTDSLVGMSIRFIKEDSNDPGTVNDFDGNVYNTVKIGNQVWMGKSLIVEHFNNGDSIPRVTGENDWLNAISAAMSFYNNDSTYAYSLSGGGGLNIRHRDTVDFIGEGGITIVKERSSDNLVNVKIKSDTSFLRIESDPIYANDSTWIKETTRNHADSILNHRDTLTDHTERIIDLENRVEEDPFYFRDSADLIRGLVYTVTEDDEGSYLVITTDTGIKDSILLKEGSNITIDKIDAKTVQITSTATGSVDSYTYYKKVRILHDRLEDLRHWPMLLIDTPGQGKFLDVISVMAVTNLQVENSGSGDTYDYINYGNNGGEGTYSILRGNNVSSMDGYQQDHIPIGIYPNTHKFFPSPENIDRSNGIGWYSGHEFINNSWWNQSAINAGVYYSSTVDNITYSSDSYMDVYLAYLIRDSVTGEPVGGDNYWDRTNGTLIPKTSTDNVEIDGNLEVNGRGNFGGNVVLNDTLYTGPVIVFSNQGIPTRPTGADGTGYLYYDDDSLKFINFHNDIAVLGRSGSGGGWSITNPNSGKTAKYGALYNWYAVPNLCPNGWHVPTETDWVALDTYLTNNGYGYGGSGKDIGKALADSVGWDASAVAGDVGNDTLTNNSSGLTFKANGLRNVYLSDFMDKRVRAYFWTSTGYSDDIGYAITLENDSDTLNYGFGRYYQDGLSVRCIKDDAINQSMIDPDGNVYATVKLDTQVWTKANLITTHLKNGTAIPGATTTYTQGQWAALTSPAMCFYDDDNTDSYTVSGGSAIVVHSGDSVEFVGDNGVNIVAEELSAERIKVTISGSGISGGGSEIDSTRLAYKDKENSFTERQEILVQKDSMGQYAGLSVQIFLNKGGLEGIWNYIESDDSLAFATGINNQLFAKYCSTAYGFENHVTITDSAVSAVGIGNTIDIVNANDVIGIISDIQADSLYGGATGIISSLNINSAQQSYGISNGVTVNKYSDYITGLVNIITSADAYGTYGITTSIQGTHSANTYGLYEHTPSLSTEYNYGIYLEDQSIGSVKSYSIYSDGGNAYIKDTLDAGAWKVKGQRMTVIRDTVISLDSAKIVHLYDTPRIVVPDPGDGYVIDVISASVRWMGGTLAYTSANPLILYQSVEGIAEWNGDYWGVTSYDFFVKFNPWQGGFMASEPLQVMVNLANPTGGNGTCKIYVTYQIRTI